MKCEQFFFNCFSTDYGRYKGVARIFGRGSAIWSETTDSVTSFASEAARRSTTKSLASYFN